jgi:hypothetical protein
MITRFAARAAAVVALMALAGSGPTGAAEGGSGGSGSSPRANHVLDGCVLNPATYAALVLDIARQSRGAIDPKKVRVSFVVVHTLNPNDGQPLKSPASAFTGPVLCAAPPLPGVGVRVERTDEQADINNIDILGAEESLILHYRPAASAGTAGDRPKPPARDRTEKRFCHTVANNTDCFRIFPRP